jgi:AraC family transcriptional regulator of arabinose operon
MTDLAARVYFGEVWYRPRGALGPRVQEDVQLVLVHEGNVWVETDGIAHTVPSGHGILLLPGGRERFEFGAHPPRRTRHTWCSVGAAAFPAPLLAWLRGCVRVGRFGLSVAHLVQAGLALRGEGRGEGPAARAVALALLRAFLEPLARGPGRPGALPAACLAALRHIEEGLARPLRTDSIARAVGLSPQHLVRVHKAALGETPAQSLWRIRLERAAGLLRATGLGIAEVAGQCGFRTEQHFSRRFRARYGLPPGAFRRR